MTVRSRLLLTLGGIILLLAVPAAYAVSQLQHLRDLAEDLEGRYAQDVLALGNLRAAVAELDRLQRSYVAAPDNAFREGMNLQLDMSRSYVVLLRGSGYEDATAPALSLLDTLTSATLVIEDLIETDRLQEATAVFQGVKPLLDSLRLTLNTVSEALDERGSRAVVEARRSSASAARTTTLAVFIAILLTVALGLWTTDALSRPLRRLGDATARVADGDFIAPENLPYDRADEIGHLSRSFGSMTHRLAELDRLKAEFVSLASHELKTPINVIIGYAELIEEGMYGETNEQQREALVLIQDQCRTLTRLVNQLLDLSRLEAGGLRVEPRQVDIDTLLGEVEQSFAALATQKSIDFKVEADGSLPELAVLDHDRVRHEVLGNLLSNAFKFTGHGGVVRVRAWSANGNVHFQVRDTGVGIPEADLPHIFEKYYQVGPDAKTKGTGLGLAIAKHVVEAHGGRIDAASREGEGTTFEIVLPRNGPPR